MAKNECIEERKDSFRVHIPYYDDLGIRRFYSKSFPIKKYGSRAKALETAKAHRDEIKVKISQKALIKEKSATLEEIYKKSADLHQCSYSTRRKNDSNFYNHIAPFISPDTDFREIRFNDIQNQLNGMAVDCSQNMIDQAFSIWKMCYRFAIADDYIAKDQTYKVSIPKSEKIIKKKDQTTTYNQFINVLDLIDQKILNDRDKQLFKGALMIMLYTGMRPSEVFALEVQAVDLENRKIKVYQRIGSTSKERYQIVKVKTDSSVREIQFPGDLLPVLEDLIKCSKDGLLFIRKSGKVLNGDIFADRLNKITDGTFRAYTLRHQLTTDLLQQNVDLRTIMELMGHSESTMTLYYARSNDQKKKQAIEERIINGKA